ncbi:10020_t:CDS:2, partial [Rhizophagus irregularis]
FAHQNNLNILSIGADGARSEFNAQTKIMNSSSTYFTFDDPFYNLLLDESDDESNIRNEDEVTNILLATFSDLRYILKQKPVPQKQFKRFDPLFTPERFAQPETSETTEKSAVGTNGGKLFAHIPAKEVLYYFNSPPFVSQGSFFTLTKENLEIFQYFKTPEMISNLAKIFHK